MAATKRAKAALVTAVASIQNGSTLAVWAGRSS